MAKLQKLAVSAALITVTVLIVNYLLSFVGYPVAPLYSISPVSGVTATAGTFALNTVGGKVLAWLGGLVPVDQFLGLSVVMIFLSSFVILLVGSFLVEKLRLPSFAGRAGRLGTTILVGTLAFYLMIVGPVMKAWNVWVGLLIHTAIVSVVAVYVGNKTKMDVL